MPPKKSRIWDHFKEKEGDPSTAICQVIDCKKNEVSRGKKGVSRALLTIESLKNHLKIHHSAEYIIFLQETENDKLEKRKFMLGAQCAPCGEGGDGGYYPVSYDLAG